MNTNSKPVIIVYHWLCCIDKYTKANLSENDKYRFINVDIIEEMYFNGKNRKFNVVEILTLNTVLASLDLTTELNVNPVVFISSNYIQYFQNIFNHFQKRYKDQFVVVFVKNTTSVLEERYEKIKDKFEPGSHFFNVTGSLNRMSGFASLARSSRIPFEELNT
jgi:hypothetical protein